MEIKFDELIKDIGSFGKYQKWMFVLLSLSILPFTFNTMGIVFMAAVPDFHCSAPQVYETNGNGHSHNVSRASREHGELVMLNRKIDSENDNMSARADFYKASNGIEAQDSGIVLGKCEVSWNESYDGGNTTKQNRMQCDSWTYDTSQYVTTIVAEWNLVCDHQWMAATSGSIYMLGLMAGCLLFGDLSDRLGRMKTFTIATVLQIAVGVGTAFSPNYITFVILRFILAMAIIGQYNSAYVLLQEIVGVNWRATVGIGIMFFWAIGYVLLGFIAMGVREWRHLQLVINCPLALLLILRWIVPESPRWLLLKGKKEAAMKVLQKIARCNGKNSIPEQKDVNVSKDQPEEAINILDIFRAKRLRKRFLIMAVVWFINSFVFYGLALNAQGLGGNVFVNFCISGGVEIPAYIFDVWVLNKFGRRLPTCITMVIGGAACVLCAFVPDSAPIVVIVCAMVGKFGITCSFSILYVFICELLPTGVRNVGLGMGSMCARIGGAVAPFVAMMSVGESRVMPMMIFGISSLAGALLVLLLPETFKRPLPDTIEDVENFNYGKNTYPCIEIFMSSDNDEKRNGADKHLDVATVESHDHLMKEAEPEA